MINEGLQHGTTSAPTRAHIIEWCRFAMNDLPAQMVRNAWRYADSSWFPLPTPAAGDNDDDTESDDESVNKNAADNADNKLDNEEEESEENNESSSGVYFSADSSANEPVDVLPSTHNKKEEEDNESSDSDNKLAPPLPSTHDFVAALESNTSNTITTLYGYKTLLFHEVLYRYKVFIIPMHMKKHGRLDTGDTGRALASSSNVQLQVCTLENSVRLRTLRTDTPVLQYSVEQSTQYHTVAEYSTGAHKCSTSVCNRRT